MMEQTAQDINKLGGFCGKRDLPALTQAAMRQVYGCPQADVMVLFGGSILAGGDVLAQAMQNGAAKKFIIVGGAGHTTQTLRETVHAICPEIKTADEPEAVVFDRYLRSRYGLHADALETQSTNCGNNITYLLELLERGKIPCRSIILCQDATMQRRMEMGLRRYRPQGMEIINYAAYQAEVVAQGSQLTYREAIPGMWTVDRYVNLLMGEIPRLTDNAAGYGPNGKNYIAHDDIPPEVQAAFERLQAVYGTQTRAANPLYASK